MKKEHNIPPLFDADSRVLILGSFPSVRSRESGFFYGHPQNRFWRVLAALLGCDTPGSIQEKRTMLLDHGVALWDVIASCDIEGSGDASIKNAQPNDLTVVFSTADIHTVFVNGSTAAKLYDRYLRGRFGDCVRLPSTSPANAAWSVERLIAAWSPVNAALEAGRGKPDIQIIKAGIDSEDAQTLIGELNGALLALTGTDGTTHFNKSDFNSPRAVFLIGYLNGIPCACGAIRELDEECGEIKRVYARPNPNGMARRIMSALESEAAQLGYKRLVLETRALNGHAVGFYENTGYIRCPGYGCYRDRKDAVCFTKRL